jgi:hypothetical protein
MSQVVHVARMEKRGLHRVFVGKPDGKRAFGRFRRRWEDSTKMEKKRDYELRHVVLPFASLRSVCLSVSGCHNSAPTGRICM